MMRAGLILDYAPELAADVVSGELPLKTAYATASTPSTASPPREPRGIPSIGRRVCPTKGVRPTDTPAAGMSTGQRAMASALVLADDGRREGGRWKRGSVDNGPGTNTDNAWQIALKRAGLVLDYAPELAADVVSGELPGKCAAICYDTTMATVATCPICEAEFTEANPSVLIKFPDVRRSAKHVWRQGAARAVCLGCVEAAQRLGFTAARDRYPAALVAVAIAPVDLDARGHCEECGVPVAYHASARRRRVYCSTRCRVKLASPRTVARSVTACSVCGNEFIPARSDARYCSNACRQKAARERAKVDLQPATDREEDRPGQLAIPQPPRLGGNRPRHAQIIGNAVVSASGLCIALDEIKALDGSLSAEEAGRLASDLNRSIRSLRRIWRLLISVS